MKQFNRGIPRLCFDLTVNHKGKLSLLFLGLGFLLVRMVMVVVLAVDTLALVTTEDTALEALTVGFLALAILAVAAG